MSYGRPLVIAHRGASAFQPENTLPAFRLAFETFHVDMVELDVQTSKDGIPVVHHDARLERATNGKGYVIQTTFRELQVLDAGHNFDPSGGGKFAERGKGIRIPSLEEVFKEFPGRSFAVEIKERSAELTHSVMALVKKYGAMDHVIVGSRHNIVSRELRKNFHGVRRFCSQGDTVSLILDFQRRGHSTRKEPLVVASLPTHGFRIRFDSLQWIEYLHSRGIQIYFWTINSSLAMKSLWIKGADGIITDDPGLLNRVLGRKFETGPTNA